MKEFKQADKTGEKLIAWNSDFELLGLVNRKEVHSAGFWHREAAAIIISPDNNLLAIKRNFDKESYPGTWGLIAGHVVGTETPEQAVITEGEEEIVLPLYPDSHQIVDEQCICKYYPNVREDNNALVTAYWIKPKSLKPDMAQFQEEEVVGFQWLRPQDFAKMIKRQDPEESIFKDNEYYALILESLERLKRGEGTDCYVAKRLDKFQCDCEMIRRQEFEKEQKDLVEKNFRVIEF